MVDKTINAGVSAQNGFALQRNTALYLLLENYEYKFRTSSYFVCLEHHDDFLFCFLNENDEAEIIEAYQSKKKSTGTWNLNGDLYDVISKLLSTGKSLISDNLPKSSSYKHILFFTSNQTIELQVKKKNTPTITESIKEDNNLVPFKRLNDKIKDKIQNGISDANLINELENLHFIWVDLNRTIEKQENQLVGQLNKLFGSQISNCRAAVKTLISLFRDIEERYNNGNVAKLLDTSKRITSQQIEDTFHILTSKSKCFDHWRNQTKEISEILQIKPFERETFELEFTTAFDLFKSIEEAEHRRILEFVRLHYEQCTTFTEEDNILELTDLFRKKESTFFDDRKLKAVFFAAYFEVILNRPHK